MVLPALKRSRWRTLHLCENNLSETGLKELVKVITSHRLPVQELDLGWNQIGPEGAELLANIIPFSCLTELILHSNEIGDAGAHQLARILPFSRLQTLDLCANAISDHGAIAIARYLPSSRLLSLDLSQNRITCTGGSRLVESMRRSTITLMNLHSNRILSPILLSEVEKTEELVRREFRVMTALCSIRAVARIGRKSQLRILPTEMLRRVAEMLYKLADLGAVGANLPTSDEIGDGLAEPQIPGDDQQDPSLEIFPVM